MGTITTILLTVSLFLLASGQRVRLMVQDSETTSNGVGRVEININGRWGTVCTDHWDSNPENAIVLCRSIGFSGGVTYSNVTGYGEGTGPIHMDNVDCFGNETSIIDCPYTDIVNCNHAEDIGVRCLDNTPGTSTVTTTTAATTTAQTPADLEIIDVAASNSTRLLGVDAGIGYVQVRAPDGTYGFVCDDGFDWNAARVVCRSLGYLDYAEPILPPAYILDSPASVNFALDDVICNGNESDLLSCAHDPWFSHNCHPSEVAIVCCVLPPTVAPTTPNISLECDDGYFKAAILRIGDPLLEPGDLSIAVQYTGPCTFNPTITTDGLYIEVTISFLECGTIVEQTATYIAYNISIFVSPRAQEGAIITRQESFRADLCCKMNWTGPDPVTFRIPTPAVPICEDGQFNITMWLSSPLSLKNLSTSLGVPVEESPYYVRVGQPLEFAVQLHTVDTRLKLVVTNCTCWAGLGVDIGNPQMRLMTEKCPVETSLKILPFNRTMMGYRYNVFQFVNYFEVTIECDAIVCLNTEDTDVCDRSCTNNKPPPSYGRRRRRRRQAETEHPVIRVFSGPVYIVNDDEPTDSTFRPTPRQPQTISMTQTPDLNFVHTTPPSATTTPSTTAIPTTTRAPSTPQARPDNTVTTTTTSTTRPATREPPQGADTTTTAIFPTTQKLPTTLLLKPTSPTVATTTTRSTTPTTSFSSSPTNGRNVPTAEQSAPATLPAVTSTTTATVGSTPFSFTSTATRDPITTVPTTTVPTTTVPTTTVPTTTVPTTTTSTVPTTIVPTTTTTVPTTTVPTTTVPTTTVPTTTVPTTTTSTVPTTIVPTTTTTVPTTTVPTTTVPTTTVPTTTVLPEARSTTTKSPETTTTPHGSTVGFEAYVSTRIVKPMTSESTKPVTSVKPMTTVSRTRRVPSSTASRPTQPAVTTGEAAPVTERPGQPAAAPHPGEIYVHREVILDQQNNMADQTPPSDTINTAPAVSAAPSVLILLLAIIWQAL